MVRIKRADSRAQLTTAVPRLQAPESFTKDLRATEASAKQLIQTSLAFENLQSLNDATNTRISFGRRIFIAEEQAKSDPNFKGSTDRAFEEMQRIMAEESNNIKDPVRNSQFRLIADTQIRDSARRISTNEKTKSINAQKNSYEVFLQDSLDKIHALRFDNPDSDSANRIAADVIRETGEMQDAFVITPDVARARIKMFETQVTSGQATYDFDQATTPQEFNVIRSRLETDFYKLGNTENEALLKKLNSLEKRKAKEAQDTQNIQYIDTFRTLLKNIDDPAEGEQFTTRAMILQAQASGEGKLPGGIPDNSGAVLIDILDNGDKNDKFQITRDEELTAMFGNIQLNDKFAALNLSDNKNKTFDALTKARIDDAPLEQMQDFIRDVVTALDKKQISVKDAEGHISRVMKEFTFRNTEQATEKAEAQSDAWTSYKRFMGITFGRTVDETARDKFINNVRSDMVNKFFSDMEETVTSNDVKNVLKVLKEQYATRTNPTVINTPDGVPNGVVNKGTPAVQIIDGESTVKPQERLNPKGNKIIIGRDRQTGQTIRFILDENDNIISQEKIE